MGESKACSWCGEVKSLSDFYRHALGKYGRQSRCKRCAAELYFKTRTLPPLTPEQFARKQELARIPERRARKNARQRERYHSDPTIRERRQEREHAYKADPEWLERRAQRQRDYLTNPAVRAHKAKRELLWLARHPEVRARRIEYSREYNTRPQSRAMTRASDAARKFGEYVDWKLMDAIAQQPCFDCGLVPAGGVDHIIPHSKGGRNVVENLQPACLPCNQSKGVR